MQKKKEDKKVNQTKKSNILNFQTGKRKLKHFGNSEEKGKAQHRKKYLANKFVVITLSGYLSFKKTGNGEVEVSQLV